MSPASTVKVIPLMLDETESSAKLINLRVLNAVAGVAEIAS